MSTEKDFVNTVYHATVDTGIAIGYAQLAKQFLKTPAPKMDFNLRDAGMLVAEFALAMYTKDMLVKRGIIPADIMK